MNKNHIISELNSIKEIIIEKCTETASYSMISSHLEDIKCIDRIIKILEDENYECE